MTVSYLTTRPLPGPPYTIPVDAAEQPMAEAAAAIEQIQLSAGTDDAKNEAALIATDDLRLAVARAL